MENQIDCIPNNLVADDFFEVFLVLLLDQA